MSSDRDVSIVFQIYTWINIPVRLYNYMDKQRTITGRYPYNSSIFYLLAGPLGLAIIHAFTILRQPSLLWRDVECNILFVWFSLLIQLLLAAAEFGSIETFDAIFPEDGERTDAALDVVI